MHVPQKFITFPLQRTFGAIGQLKIVDSRKTVT